MTSEVCGTDDGVCSVDQNSCFFACLKIIGFKNFVKSAACDQVEQIDNDLNTNCKAIVDEVLEIAKGNENDRIDRERWIDFRIDNGTIYVWTKNDERLIQFDYLLFIVNALLVWGLEQRLPMKGVLAFGDLFSGGEKKPGDLLSCVENDLIWCPDMVEAHRLEAQMNWSGVILTRNVWSKIEREFEKGEEDKRGRVMRSWNIKSAKELFNPFSYLIRYDRGGAIAINWNYDTSRDLTEDKIRKAFEGPCVQFYGDVNGNLCETLKFFEHTQWIARLRELKRKAQIEGRALGLSDLIIKKEA